MTMQMDKIKELIDEVVQLYPTDDFFRTFWSDIEVLESIRRKYIELNAYLSVIDTDSWRVLKAKAIEHFKDHREGQRKQGFFNQLNESKAYSYLKKSGCVNLRFIPEEKNKTPDIEGKYQDNRILCEVKTIDISEDEINRRRNSEVYDISVYCKLSKGFVNKFKSAFENAKSKFFDYSKTDKDILMVYFVISFDDFVGYYNENYEQQLKSIVNDLDNHIHVVIHNFDYEKTKVLS